MNSTTDERAASSAAAEAWRNASNPWDTAILLPEEEDQAEDPTTEHDCPNWCTECLPALGLDYLEPLVGFNDPDDWSGCQIEPRSYTENGKTFHSYETKAGVKIELQPRLMARVDPLISQANGQHDRGQHETGSHPWCERCELRFLRSPYNGNDRQNFGLDDALILRVRRPTIESRVLGLLVRDNGRVPTFGPRPPIDADAAWTSLMDLMSQEPPGFLFDGVLPENGLGYLTGRDGTFKTFLALDLAMHLAAGREEWHGRAMGYNGEWAPEVVFVAGEGSHSFGRRIKAWLTEYPWELAGRDQELTEELASRLHIRSGSVNLFTGGPAYDELLKLCQERKPALVVVDTLQTNSTGAESNSASDMGEVTARLHALKLASGGTVLVLAHTGKSDVDARGSSSIEDDADYVLHIKPTGNDLAVTVAKQKDGESGFVVPLRAVPVHGSVVIRERSDVDEEDSSFSNRSRVLGAVKVITKAQRYATATDVLATVKTDPSGIGEMPRSTAYEWLGKLTDQGVLLANDGTGASKKYTLNPDHTDNEGWL